MIQTDFICYTIIYQCKCSDIGKCLHFDVSPLFDGNRIVLITFSKSNLLAFYLSPTSVSPLLSYCEFSFFPTAKWIVERNYQDGSLPMWRKLGSFVRFVVWFVELLHYRGHLVPFKAYWCLLVSLCPFTPCSCSQNLAPVSFVFRIFSALLVLVWNNC